MKAKFKASIELTKSLARELAFPLLGLFLLSSILNIAAEDAMQAASPAEETMRYVAQLLQGIWEMVEGVVLVLLLSWALPKVHKFKAKDLMQEPFTTPYLGSFFAEYLRMLAQILMWGLLLLIPGFVRYAQLIFVPYITLFSKSYRAGEIDALQTSRALVKGRLGLTAGILIGLMALQFAVEFLPQFVTDLHTIPFRVVFGGLGFLISIWSYSLIFVLFESFLVTEEK